MSLNRDNHFSIWRMGQNRYSRLCTGRNKQVNKTCEYNKAFNNTSIVDGISAMLLHRLKASMWIKSNEAEKEGLNY